VGENQGDNYTYIWTVTGVSSFEDKSNSISFNPSGLENTQISITVVTLNSAEPKLTGGTSMNCLLQLFQVKSNQRHRIVIQVVVVSIYFYY
jgi:hypothetical protein